MRVQSVSVNDEIAVASNVMVPLYLSFKPNKKLKKELFPLPEAAFIKYFSFGNKQKSLLQTSEEAGVKYVGIIDVMLIFTEIVDV